MERLSAATKSPPFPIVRANQRSVLGVAFTFAIVPVVAVVLRIVARRVAARSLDVSDHCIVVACVFAVALEGVSITGVLDCGIGYGHTQDIMVEYGVEPITKLLKTIPGGHCGNQVLSFTVTGVLNLITDVIVLLLPLPYMYKLQMRTCKKLVLMGVFSIGLVTCIVSAIRIKTLSSMDYTDITYSMPSANIFSGLELSIAVTLACIPLLRPLLNPVSRSSKQASDSELNDLPRVVKPRSKDLKSFELLDDNTQ